MIQQILQQIQILLNILQEPKVSRRNKKLVNEKLQELLTHL